MKNYFVALIPDNKIRAEVSEAKLKVFELFGNQKYLVDPPHSTLYVSLANDLTEVENRLEKLASNENVINTKILNEFQEFSEDSLAGGGTSLGLKFDKESNLKITSLQKKVADTLNNLRKEQVHPRYKNVKLPDFMMQSIEKYGFPFVSGDDDKPILIPHVSFCCFNPSENAEKFKEIYPIEKFSGNMNFPKLALYKLYEDDKTELIRYFELQ
jgi:hypothetical protein